jgi:BT1 family
MPPTTEVRPADKPAGGMLAGLGMLFGLLYFVQGIVEPTDGLLSQPTKSLLRQWEHSAASAAWFATILSLPWTIKPLYGLLTDFVPLAGSHRRSHLLLTTAVACAGLSVLYLLPLGSDSGPLLLMLLLLPAVAIAYSDVVTDALMIEVGQPRGLTGRLQSIQWASIYAATIFTGVTGGALSEAGLQQLGFLIAGLSCAVSFFAVWLLVRDPGRSPAAACPGLVGDSGPRAGVQFRLGRALAEMGQTFREPGVLTIGAFLFFWNFNPFSSTVLYYYSTTNLQFSEQFVGTLTSWQAVGGVVGSVLYGVFCRAMPVPWLIHGSIVTGILATLAYWGYRDPASAVLVSVSAGLVYAIGSLVQLDLAARVCRPVTAGTTFALLMSLSNLSLSLSQGVGGSMFEAMARQWGNAWAFQLLVAAGALATAACWLLLPVLNHSIVAAGGAGAAPG